MDQSNKSTVILLLFVTFFACITATDSVVVSVNSMLNVTLSTSKFIASKRIQILEIINNPSNITTFKLTFFNRSAQRYSNVYTYNVSGTWSVISQTHQTLSCSLVYENSSQAFRLLKFKNEGGVFSLLGKLTLSNVDPNPNSFKVGENCQIIQVLGTIYRVSNSLSPIKVPLGWSVQSSSQSFTYVVSQGKLYRYNGNQNQYDPIYSLGVFQGYRIFQKSKRVIVVGSNSVGYYNDIYLVAQKVYYFEDEVTGLVLIGSSEYNGYSAAPLISISVSPQLTKLGFSYVPANTVDYSLVVVVKNIDYINNQIFDVTFNGTQLVQTITGIYSNELSLHQEGFAVRNASGKVASPSAAAVEEVYWFVGNKIVYFGGRTLSGNREWREWSLISADSFSSNKVVVFNVYQITNGFTVQEVSYTNVANVTPVPPANIEYIQFALKGRKL